jgi:histidinol-phosphate aminotransferase
MFSIEPLLRDNIKQLVPYSSAREEFKGEANIFLDANENSLGSPLIKWYNRYPDPLQRKVKQALSAIKRVPQEKIFLGNGSDECIDLLYRAFCRPGKDNVIIHPPTYGMYEVSAHINDVEVRRCRLTDNFQLDLPHLETLIDAQTKIIWICSPNNPTGNCMDRQDIEIILNNFDGLVVVDEAYINFARQRSLIQELDDYPNLVILQTLSKAWGLAGLRLGMAFASEQIVGIFNKIKPPYNISQIVQEWVLRALEETEQVNEMIRTLVTSREWLASKLGQMKLVHEVLPSEANFLLVRIENPIAAYKYLLSRGIVVRDRSKVELCENALRITVGTDEENRQLITSLEEYSG